MYEVTSLLIGHCGKVCSY